MHPRCQAQSLTDRGRVDQRLPPNHGLLLRPLSLLCRTDHGPILSNPVRQSQRLHYAVFETAFEILRAMRDHGNLAATEFYDNLECVQQCLDQTQPSRIHPSAKRGSTARHSLTGESRRVPDQHPTDVLPVLPDQAARRTSEVGLSGGSALPDTSGGALGTTFGNEMVFLDDSMEQFFGTTGC